MSHDRHIVHIKDVFQGDNKKNKKGAATKQDKNAVNQPSYRKLPNHSIPSDTQDVPKPPGIIQASHSDVYFKPLSTDGDAGAPATVPPPPVSPAPVPPAPVSPAPVPPAPVAPPRNKKRPAPQPGEQTRPMAPVQKPRLPHPSHPLTTEDGECDRAGGQYTPPPPSYSHHIAATPQLVPTTHDEELDRRRVDHRAPPQLPSSAGPTHNEAHTYTVQAEVHPNQTTSTNGYMSSTSEQHTKEYAPGYHRDNRSAAASSAMPRGAGKKATRRNSTSGGTFSSGYYSEGLDSSNGMNGPSKADSDSDFDEDECTLVFDDEDDGKAEDRHHRVYKEYQGEDFAQYLQDDENEAGNRHQSTKGRHKKCKQRTPSTAQSSPSHSAGKPATTPDKFQHKKAGLKEKLTSVFTLTKSDARSRYLRGNRHPGNLQNFTYADSKMGTVESGSRRPRDVQSDIGEYSPKSWWNKETISAKTLGSNSDIMVRPKKALSVSDLTSMTHVNGNVDQGYSDFESQRKDVMYGSKGKDKKNKKSTNIFRKFSKTLRNVRTRSDPEVDNTAVNPLSVMADAGIEDVRL